VGVSLVFFGTSIITAIATFGIVTFLLSFLGIQFGYKFGSFFGQKVEAVGGLILIGIGTKILIEHLV
jgi:putative Mn2+ efflux pump MntP